MLWNIWILPLSLSFALMAPKFIVLVQAHLNKMVGLNGNIVTFLTLPVPFSFRLHVLNTFGGEAVLTAAYTINHSPTPILNNSTPHERLYGSPPDFSSLRVFGSACFVLLQPHERTKLEPRSRL